MKNEIQNLIDKGQFVNDSDIDGVILAFFQEFSAKISFLTRKAYGECSDVSLRSFKAVLLEDLKNGIIAFINNKYNLKSLKPYLIVCAENSCKRITNNGGQYVYTCPACTYLDLGHYKSTKCLLSKKSTLTCLTCTNALANEEDASKIILYKTFSEHSKKGYKCPDCNRFIPKNKDNKNIISCPFPDCFFSGELNKNNISQHPRTKTNLEVSILDMKVNEDLNQTSFKDNLSDTPGYIFSGPATQNSTTNTNLSVREAINTDYNLLMQVIDTQVSVLEFSNNASTLIHKKLIYQAFKIIIDKFPKEMISYLVHLSVNVGMQHLIFQEYTRLLEKSFPYTYLEKSQPITITSLLDPNLNIFSGTSTFETKVKDNNYIKNMTNEVYFGGRKGAYCEPYYMGKLLEVIDLSTNQSILNNVVEYSFFKAKFDSAIKPGTSVQITHLRIPPHFQMGTLSYLNRIRRKIVDKVYFQKHGKKREMTK